LRRRRRRIERRIVARAAPLLAAFVLSVAQLAAAQPPDTDAARSAVEPEVAAQRSAPETEVAGQRSAPETDVATQSGDASASSTLLDRFLDEITTLEAHFEQELWTADDQLLDRQSGSLALERPSRFRWHYVEPFEQLVVADGKNLWMHDVELDTVTVTPLDDTVASSPAMLLSGDRAVRDGFAVVDEFRSDGLSWLRLEPELEGTDFRSVLLGFDDLTPRRLELVDGLGQITRITLSDVELNAELDDRLFLFNPPRGVDVIGNPAR